MVSLSKEKNGHDTGPSGSDLSAAPWTAHHFSRRARFWPPRGPGRPNNSQKSHRKCPNVFSHKKKLQTKKNMFMSTPRFEYLAPKIHGSWDFFKMYFCHQSGRHWPDSDDTLGFESRFPGARFGPVPGPWGARKSTEKNKKYKNLKDFKDFGANYSNRGVMFKKATHFVFPTGRERMATERVATARMWPRVGPFGS